jgi:hypothetical protein
MARRRRKRQVSYPAALAAAAILVAKHEMQQRTGMALWGPLATRLLVRRFGPQATALVVKQAGHWTPIAARLIAQRLGYRSAMEMAARMGSGLIRRAQGEKAPPQQSPGQRDTLPTGR